MVFALAFLWILTFVGPATAQDKAKEDPCAINRQVISTLTRPHFGTPAVWEAAYGRPDRLIRLVAGIPDDDGTVFATGLAIDKKILKPVETVIVQVNRRRKPLIEKRIPLRGAEDPYRMAPAGENLAVLSDMDGRVRLAFYGMDGAFKSERMFAEPGYMLEAADLAADGKGLIALFHASRAKRPGDEYSIVARLSEIGTVVWRRTYQPGPDNMLMDIVPDGGGGYVAAGRIRNEDGRQAGWIMRLGGDGAILWQRSYARGAFALMRGVAVLADGYAVAGEARPFDGGAGSAWIMKTDGQGSPVWQRFYRREDSSLGAFGLASLPDGRIEAALNARAGKGSKDPDHIRLLTLSPNGVLLKEQDHLRGIGARGRDFSVDQAHRRVVTASMDGGKDSETQSSSRYQGWVFVTEESPSYVDPCVAP